MAKKKVLEIKGGTKLQKVCLFLQIILIIVMLGSAIYANVNNIQDGFITEIPYYGLFAQAVLLIFPVMFQGNK